MCARFKILRSFVDLISWTVFSLPYFCSVQFILISLHLEYDFSLVWLTFLFTSSLSSSYLYTRHCRWCYSCVCSICPDCLRPVNLKRFSFNMENTILALSSSLLQLKFRSLAVITPV